ncbi:EamA family transporter [Pseudoduganella violacea]|uniref:Drug/metabolite transporter (DMT)-like permease n=1 Tax=Pseudoduganella violacea TaxID=1715466 RepID=A0A7W5B935_9BURK|nr:EamA family transporter [Pseudoduganella violacea]MBB3118125.1 drug/metabolite transporter (DMT)-like permease [Pseudoduganella violacea]
MNPTVVAIVLLAAFLHAGWNALVKAGKDAFLTSVLVASGAALISLAALPFLPAPAPASLPYVLASTLIHFFYYGLLSAAYRHGDMSLAYPLMRGSAPLLVAVASRPLLGEVLNPQQYLAIAYICSGIFGLYLATRRPTPAEAAGSAVPSTLGADPNRTRARLKDAQATAAPTGSARRATLFALLNAVAIAAYTLVDGIGARKSGAPAAYTMYLFVLTAIGLLAWTLARRPAALRAYARQHWRVALLGGLGTLASYGLALWAMTVAPVAAVAALRETAILFAAAIAALFLREKIGWRRAAAIGFIAGGAALMRFA